MTPLRFELTYQDEWTELESLLDRALGRTVSADASVSGARLASLYRRACGHLALARARCYPAHIIDRLERLTADAHQLIYRHHELGFERFREILSVEFPSAVRAHWPYVLVAAAVFLLPAIVIGVLVYVHPELILSVVDSDTAASFEQMYSPSAASIGRVREATTDWVMFGIYIRNNVSVAFQCFAGGLFFGLGSLFYLAYNGAYSGAVAGFLTERGLSSTFYSFVATHSAFELTAIVVSGAAGLRIGHALLAPRRLRRVQALIETTRDCATLLYGLSGMLLLAAVVEAFWSSATWLPVSAKYSMAAVCWSAVFSYFTFAGRRAD